MSDRAAWRAPGRVNLIGEHTDYNDGWVLPFAVPLGVTATVTGRDDARLRVTSSSFPDAEAVLDLDRLEDGDARGDWAAYVAGVAWALQRSGHSISAVSVHLDSDLPLGAGLSSSAAVECAVAGALSDVFGLGLDVDAIVRIAHDAENGFVGVPCGVLDQSAVARCRAGHALFLDTRTSQSRQVPLPLSEQGLAVLVIDTRTPHRLVDSEYATRRRQCRQAAELLGLPALRDAVPTDLERLPDETLRHRARHVVTENARVHETVARLDVGDMRGIGDLLTASHRSLRYDFEVSSARLDLAVDAALADGALGARMIGGGFGGSAIALVDALDADRTQAAVIGAFAVAGFSTPNVFAATAVDGAHRL